MIHKEYHDKSLQKGRIESFIRFEYLFFFINFCADEKISMASCIYFYIY